MDRIRIQNWTMSYIHDDCVQKELTTFSLVLQAGGAAYPAEVPGNFELDLVRAGVLPDPFQGEAILQLQEFEDCHVFYKGTFQWGEETAKLVLEGVDTIADLYINGQWAGFCENMLIAHEFSLANLQEGENELFVHIRPVCLEARRYGIPMGATALRYNFESLTVRKAPHTFGWDITPRAVSAGLWRDVYIEKEKSRRIEESYIMVRSLDPASREVQASLRYSVDIGRDKSRDFSLTLEGRCGDSRFTVTETALWFTSGVIHFTVPDCRIWYPRGRGEQNLYTVILTLRRGDEIVDTAEYRYGFRTAELRNSEILDESGKGEFQFYINHEPVFLLGTNWVPADVFHSRDKARIPGILQLVAEEGCNAIRCWGGNVYEDDVFYELCDEYGFIVWQDFTLACGTYPQDERLQSLLREEATAVVKRLRNHPCLCLWAGDNECDVMIEPLRNPEGNLLTRKVLPEVLYSHDGTRPYLPSSPYVSDLAYRTGKIRTTSEQHIWGPRDYFKGDFYRGANPCFASEVGYHGCPSPDSVAKFIDADSLWPPEQNRQWLVHSASPELMEGAYTYRIGLMTDQIRYLFGAKPANLDEYAAMSQISQAEADKFFIEKFRIAKGHTSGIILWNIMDNWPQFSDAVVDYYFRRKIAFWYIQASQQQVCLMMDDKDGVLTLYGVNDLRTPVQATYSVEDALTHETALQGKVELSGDSSAELARMEQPEDHRFYLIRWSYGETAGCNHYLSFRPPVSFEWYIRCLREAKLYSFEGFDSKEGYPCI